MMSTLMDTLQLEYTSSARIFSWCTEVMKILAVSIDWHWKQFPGFFWLTLCLFQCLQFIGIQQIKGCNFHWSVHWS